MSTPKTTILIHGLHLGAEGWGHIIWGDPVHGVLGRVPRALMVALREPAELIFWGSGASEQEGKKESEMILSYTKEHWKDLEHIPEFDALRAKELVERVSHIDLLSQNTKEEIVNAAHLCEERGITRLILVSSPTHISRCLLEAEKLRAEGGLQGIEVFATASDVSYQGTTPEDVFIVEPPHRGDRPKVFLNKTLRPINKIRKDQARAEGLNKDLEQVIAKWDTL